MSINPRKVQHNPAASFERRLAPFEMHVHAKKGAFGEKIKRKEMTKRNDFAFLTVQLNEVTANVGDGG